MNNKQLDGDKSDKQPETAVFVAEKLQEVNQVVQNSLAGLTQAKQNLEKMIDGEGEIQLGELMMKDAKVMLQVTIDASQEIGRLHQSFLNEFEKESEQYEAKKNQMTEPAEIEELETQYKKAFGEKVVELNHGLREVLNKITESQEKMKHDMISMEIELLREIIRTL